MADDRRKVSSDLGSIHWELDGLSVPDAIKFLEGRIEAYADRNFDRLYLDWASDYDNTYVLSLKGERLETDEEMAIRKERDRRWEEDRAAAERATFERLKKKFGGDKT